MAVDYYLAMDGIPGESTASGYEHQIDVIRWSWNQEFQPKATQESNELPALAVGVFRIIKGLDKATPKLMLACASRQFFPRAILTCLRSGATPSKLLRVTMSDLQISSYRAGVAPESEDRPLEEIGITFARIEFESTELRADGTEAGVIRSGWDIRANQSC